MKPQTVGRLVNIVRRFVQATSAMVLVLLPLLALYTHYHSARALDDLPPGWRTTAIRQIDRFVGQDEKRLEVVQRTQGTFWSARVAGYSISDPLAGLEAIAGSRAFYVPLLWSLLLPVALSVVLGRFFCGWICPMNTLLEIVDRGRKLLRFLELRSRDIHFSKHTKYFVLAFSLGFVALSGVPFLAMIYPPAVISREVHLYIFGVGIGLGTYVILAICFFELFVSRRWWCRYICPGGAVYSLLGRGRLLRIQRDDEKCVQCGECVRVCQFDLRPMLVDLTGMECTNCASCIRACDSDALTYQIVVPGTTSRRSGSTRPKSPGRSKLAAAPTAGARHRQAPVVPDVKEQPTSTSGSSQQGHAAPASQKLGRSLLLAAIITGTLLNAPADGHHILGLPHYSYKENYPQAPTLEYPATTGPYDVLMTSYPGRPTPGEAATIAFYIKNRNTGRPYGQPVTVRVLRTSTFGGNELIYPPATHQPFDNQHKFTITFPTDAEYIVELTMDVEGREEVIPFLMVVGEPTATASVVAALATGLGVFLVVVRAIKKKRDRRRKQAIADDAPIADVHGASQTDTNGRSNPLATTP